MLMTNTSCRPRGRQHGKPNVAHQHKRYKDVSRNASFGGKISFPNSCPLLDICCTVQYNLGGCLLVQLVQFPSFKQPETDMSVHSLNLPPPLSLAGKSAISDWILSRN